jgi:hypothetical protein
MSVEPENSWLTPVLGGYLRCWGETVAKSLFERRMQALSQSLNPAFNCMHWLLGRWSGHQEIPSS